MLLWQTVKSQPERHAPEISYSRFVTRVAASEISTVKIAGNVVLGYDTQGGSFRVIVPPNHFALIESLEAHGVEIWFTETTEQNWAGWILNFAPLVLLAALWLFMIRQMKNRGAVGYRPSTSMPPQESKPGFGS